MHLQVVAMARVEKGDELGEVSSVEKEDEKSQRRETKLKRSSGSESEGD